MGPGGPEGTKKKKKLRQFRAFGLTRISEHVCSAALLSPRAQGAEYSRSTPVKTPHTTAILTGSAFGKDLFQATSRWLGYVSVNAEKRQNFLPSRECMTDEEHNEKGKGEIC